jgi:hypothetical protein
MAGWGLHPRISAVTLRGTTTAWLRRLTGRPCRPLPRPSPAAPQQLRVDAPARPDVRALLRLKPRHHSSDQRATSRRGRPSTMSATRNAAPQQLGHRSPSGSHGHTSPRLSGAAPQQRRLVEHTPHQHGRASLQPRAPASQQHGRHPLPRPRHRCVSVAESHGITPAGRFGTSYSPRSMRPRDRKSRHYGSISEPAQMNVSPWCLPGLKPRHHNSGVGQA